MSMHLASRLLPALALATASLTLLFATPLQDPVDGPDEVVEEPVEDEEDAVDPEIEALFGNADPLRDWTLPERWQDMIGTWQLMEFDHVDDIFDSENIGGYVHMGEGVMTMIIHVRNKESGDLPEFMGQAGLHRWRMVRGDILQTATMMAHSNMGEDFEWEQPNTPREFRVTLGAGELVLERPDASRLVLRRVRGFAFPEDAITAIEAARGEVQEE